MKKFFIKSMGCKANQAEGLVIEQNLLKSGFVKVKNQASADFYILNSCSVTHKSDNEAMYLLRKAHSDGLKTILTGCIAQIERDKLLTEPFIDYVFGNEDKFCISDFLKNETNFKVSDLSEKEEFNKSILETSPKTRISLKIQDGCDNRCAYCIIPFARGKSRCADVDFILDRINDYSAQGFKEVVLTGIHVGLWKDNDGRKLFNLLRLIDEKTSIKRYRIGSLNPLEITSEMLDYLKNSEKFCPHFHLSLQSMCDKTLKSMNRFYSAQRCLELIDEIYEKMPLAFMGSDIIAGFACETDEDFNVTVSNLKKSKLSEIHTFPYSVRKGTQAEKMEGHLSDKIKEERAEIIKKISAEKYENFVQRNIGTVHNLLIEKHLDKNTGYLKGVTENYLTVLIENNTDTSLCNTMHQIKITEKTDKYDVLSGELLNC